ncbi:response regulator [Synergistales bacterium]|nr:response regulator [Synergistales bacterium]
MEKTNKTIVIVDDNPANLKIGKGILAEFYGTFTKPSAIKMFELLENTIPDLILLDIEMPEMDGYEAIKRLKENPRTRDIPVIFLTSRSDSESEIAGLDLGAVDYIFKPFSPALLLKRIKLHMLVADQTHELKNYNDNLRHMVKEKTRNVHDLQETVMRAIANLVEFRDSVTGGHVERTGRVLSVLLDGALRSGVYDEQISSWDADLFLQSAQLHDVGKIAIRDDVLLKPGRLTNEEFEVMKKHASYGVDIIEKIKLGAAESSIAFLDYAQIFAGSHHEKWDGSGYPNHLTGESIPLQGRLMAIVDVYDALVSERPYKKAMTHEEALKIIEDGKGSHFDPLLTKVFLDNAEQVHAVSSGVGEKKAS